ncbi:MAG TPA: zinc ribbon domain-containing protein [Gemmatimonadales bacterium]|nr:zinc ribbon domain-containing protein [Gemmatimonadales bacterium]
MLELVAGVVLAAGAVLFVLRPILQPAWAASLEAAAAADGEDYFEDVSPTAVALRALKEIEFDRATGKLSDADYESLKAQYTAEAIAVMREAMGKAAVGTGEGGRGKGGPGRTPAIPHSPFPVSVACPVHGPGKEPGAEFCSACGRRLQEANGFCSRCGVSLERDAQFCHRCGTRVAA